MAEIGDIVQITNENHHWFPCLIVVSEPKSWGVQGYITIPNNERDKPNGNAFIRINHDEFEVVGHAALIRGDMSLKLSAMRRTNG